MGEARPFVVPVFIPHSGCAHRCVFCNQNPVTGVSAPMRETSRVAAEISRFLQYRRGTRSRTEIAFFGGNFLGLPFEQIQSLLDCAAGFVRAGQANGIRFSTRPDTINDDTLGIFDAYPITTVELGVQSMDDDILGRIRRGHTAEDATRAVAQLKSRPCRLGLQMMVGLPGEDAAKTRSAGTKIVALEPDFVRIYPTLVIRGSALARWYAEGRYTPLEMTDCIDRVKGLFRLFSARGIPVIRMGLQANEGLDAGRDLIAGPYHPSFGQMVMSALFYDAAAGAMESAPAGADTAIIRVHPRQISTMRGLKNTNMTRLHNRFSRIRFTVAPDPGVDYQEMILHFPGCEKDIQTKI